MKYVTYLTLAVLLAACSSTRSISTSINTSSTDSQPRPVETEVWEPVPAIIEPGTSGNAPSDAIVLFDGSNLDEWEHTNGSPVKWELKDGAMTVVHRTGDIRTKKKFGSIQLHIEWRTPSVVKGEGQGRGNSGIFLQEKYELQVLDSYQNSTYSNGQAGSIYKQSIPLVNACRPPGTWQTYDIIYHAPVFKDDGTFEKQAKVTVLQNGVLIQDEYKIKGTTEYRSCQSCKLPQYLGTGARLKDPQPDINFNCLNLVVNRKQGVLISLFAFNPVQHRLW
jgi:hypothetical protein